MRIPRTIPVVLLLSALIYIPIVVSRNALPTMSWEATFGVPHTLFVRLLFYAILALFSVAIMSLCGNISWREFGFRSAHGKWLGLGGMAALLGVITTLVVKKAGGSGLDTAMAGISPVELLTVLLVATCVEEIFVRGWIQGFLEPLQQYKIGFLGKSVSAPVLTGALVFGAMHLSLTAAAIDALTIVCVLVFTTLLGLLAGLARERTGSLMPAIGTHLAGNIGGIVGGIVYVIVSGAAAHA
jgi:membrane protease YdiL (CAAX protease family)